MTLSEIRGKITNKIWDNIKNYFYNQRVVDSPLVMNLNNIVTDEQPKVLICYLTNEYFINLDNNVRRTISFEILKIVKVFSEFGFCIDIIGFNDIKSLASIKDRQYSMIFGFGETFYQMVKLQPEAISILYMTENHPCFSFQEEKKRIDYFYARHRRHARFGRSGNFYKLKHLDTKYSYVITLSETEPLKCQYDRPYFIFPTGIINPKYKFKYKDHQSSKMNFLWLGSYGAIHKGLDLLLDVFSKRDDIILHICGLSKQDRKILKIQNRRNIVEYGHIDIRSNFFLNIVETCSFIILPSCSEACSTSVTTGMLHGLIPIVMKDSGFNRLADNAIFLDDYKIEYLDSKLSEFINFSSKELELISKKVFDFAQQNFLIAIFEENFRTIMQDILKKS